MARIYFLLLISAAVLILPMTTEAADCWSNGWSCQDGGCFRNGGSCQTIKRLPKGRPVCRCVYGRG